MRTPIVAAFAAVMMGSLFPIGAAECKIDEKLFPALLRDAAKAVKVCPEDVFVFTDARQLFAALGAADPEGLAGRVTGRAFVIGHKLPIFLRGDEELKSMFALYEAEKISPRAKQALLAFLASWLEHEKTHIGGEPGELAPMKAELQKLKEMGVNLDDPHFDGLKKRYAALKNAAKKGEGHDFVAFTVAPPSPPPRAVEGVLPYKGEQATTLVALANDE